MGHLLYVETGLSGDAGSMGLRRRRYPPVPTCEDAPMNIALSTFAAWPKTVYGRVAFTAACPCGRDAVWEQVGQAGLEHYEISCPCEGSTHARSVEPDAA
jgi:hypothetical protein